MIRIKINNNLITVEGHANYDNNGKDIVCASVSSIIYTTVNGIKNIDEGAIEFRDDNKLLKIKIIKEDKIVRSLIDNMIVLLEDLERQYPKNIKISKGEDK